MAPMWDRVLLCGCLSFREALLDVDPENETVQTGKQTESVFTGNSILSLSEGELELELDDARSDEDDLELVVAEQRTMEDDIQSEKGSAVLCHDDADADGLGSESEKGDGMDVSREDHHGTDGIENFVEEEQTELVGDILVTEDISEDEKGIAGDKETVNHTVTFVEEVAVVPSEITFTEIVLDEEERDITSDNRGVDVVGDEEKVGIPNEDQVLETIAEEDEVGIQSENRIAHVATEDEEEGVCTPGPDAATDEPRPDIETEEEVYYDGSMQSVTDVDTGDEYGAFQSLHGPGEVAEGHENIQMGRHLDEDIKTAMDYSNKGSAEKPLKVFLLFHILLAVSVIACGKAWWHDSWHSSAARVERQLSQWKGSKKLNLLEPEKWSPPSDGFDPRLKVKGTMEALAQSRKDIASRAQEARVFATRLVMLKLEKGVKVFQDYFAGALKAIGEKPEKRRDQGVSPA